MANSTPSRTSSLRALGKAARRADRLPHSKRRCRSIFRPLRFEHYFLDISQLNQTGHDIAVALKQANATSVIFTGDPIMPEYFTKEATAQNYHPEWIMAGTVLADTSVFARTFDQSQWAHAIGIG